MMKMEKGEEKRRVWKEVGFWTVYGILVGLRLVLALVSPGYVHPDEFFQNPEAAAGLVFGGAGLGWARTWEFRAAQVRSPTLPALTTGVPFALLHAVWRPPALPPPAALFFAPRAVFFALSLTLDACVAVLGARHKDALHWRRALLTLAGAWPVLTLAVRPFSNTTELLLLAALLCVASDPAPLTVARAALIPALGALGVFNRATFVAFAAPIAAYHVFRCVRDSGGQGRKNWPRALLLLGIGLATFVGTAGAIIASDTFLYARLNGEDKLGSPVLAPLNFLRYNANAANLAQHGTHPRWLHAAVNVPLLALPLLPGAVRTVARTCARPAPLPALCAAVVASAVAVLSAAPHQELRFVLPLIFPLIILSCWKGENKGKEGKDKCSNKCRGIVAVALYAVFNMVLTAYFGFAQQGGVVPALVHVGTQMRRADAAPQQQLVFWHTYMPPPHLLAAPRTRYTLTDLGSAPLSALLATVDAALVNRTHGTCTDVWVAAPAVETAAVDALTARGLERTAAFAPHVGLDNGEAAAYRAAPTLRALEEIAALDLFQIRVGDCSALEDLTSA